MFKVILFGLAVGWVLSLGRRREPKPEDIDQPENAAAEPPTAEELVAWLEDNGLQASGLNVEVAGATVKVSGKVTSQEEREKIVIALGNVQGISKVEDGMEVEAPAPESTYYTVRKGDTLWAIARAQYGDGNKYRAIFEANRPMLADPDKIYPGQVLRIPSQAG